MARDKIRISSRSPVATLRAMPCVTIPPQASEGPGLRASIAKLNPGAVSVSRRSDISIGRA
ncbi:MULTISPECIES: hypothetical protein [Paracoccus]|uniref:hypothetical protein n=1 Tax=Paracoccus TaxID=265 RepID=UPI001FB662A5|nr:MULTISPECIES: hypothetical protein [Paracoccus]MCJ1902890.1 hypothetical protein [Paracoccus versutus]MDF3907395.1 hypothetical protein [Paracoccus sp. AS002]